MCPRVSAGDEAMNARAPASALDTTLPSEAAAEADRKGFAVPAVRNAVLERVRTIFFPQLTSMRTQSQKGAVDSVVVTGEAQPVDGCNPSQVRLPMRVAAEQTDHSSRCSSSSRINFDLCAGLGGGSGPQHPAPQL